MADRTRIFLDLETIPDQSEGAEERAKARISAPANFKDPAKIEAYIESKAAEAWRKTSLNGTYGELFCIGYGLDNDPANVLYRNLDDGPDGEAELLASFWDMVRGDLTVGAMWVGHNVQRFDLRFLWQRSVIRQVQPELDMPHAASPYGREIADTMMMWTGDRNSFISLDDLLQALGIESIDPIDGSEVWDYIEKGEPQKVLEHCVRNVEETREAWRRMMFWPVKDDG